MQKIHKHVSLKNRESVLCKKNNSIKLFPLKQIFRLILNAPNYKNASEPSQQ